MVQLRCASKANYYKAEMTKYFALSVALGCREGVKQLFEQSVHLRWLPIHYFNRNAVANLLNIDLSRKVLGLLPVC